MLALLKTSHARPQLPKYIDMCVSNVLAGVSVGQSLLLAKQMLDTLPEQGSSMSNRVDRYSQGRVCVFLHCIVA